MPSEPELRDHSGSRAVLIGTWDYEHLPPVPAAQHSLQRMSDLLTSPICGWPPDRITMVANRARPGDLFDDLVELYSQTDSDGVALFYFVGHGQPDSDDRLCLGLAGSRTEAARRASTSLLFDNVRDALRQADAGTKVVILDCCFAGLAAANKLSGGDFLDMVRGTGAYTMAASGAYSPAWFEDDQTITRPQTFFTKYFVDTVEAGIPHERAVLPLDVIFATAADRLVRDGKPKPTSTVRHEAGRLAFARNLTPATDPVDSQAEIARLTAKLEEAQAHAEELAERNLEAQRQIQQLLSTRQHNLSTEEKRDFDDRLDSLARSLNDTAAETAQAVDDRERVRHALVEVAPALQVIPLGTGHEWDDVELAASTLPVAEVLRRIAEVAGAGERGAGDEGTAERTEAQDRAVQRILLSCGLRPVPELAELAIGLKRSDRDADARTVLRLAAQRTGDEIADLVRRLRAAPLPEPERQLLGPMTPVGPDRTTADFFAQAEARHEEFFRSFSERKPLSHAVLAPAAVRPAGEVVEVATALAESGADADDIRYLLQCAGWQKSSAQITELVEALRTAGRDADADVVLERAGGRPVAVVAELIQTAAAQGRKADIQTILRGKPLDPRSAKDRRTLAATLKQTSLDEAVWRPALKGPTLRERWTAQSQGFGWSPGPTLARFVPYSVAALLIGLGLSQHAAAPGLGWLNWLATVGSAAIMLIAARLIYWTLDELVWNGFASFHHGSEVVLIPVMAACFLTGYVLLPLAGADPLGLALRNWMAWRF